MNQIYKIEKFDLYFSLRLQVMIVKSTNQVPFYFSISRTDSFFLQESKNIKFSREMIKRGAILIDS